MSDVIPKVVVRYQEHELGVYVWPDPPDWCVPNSRGDFILSRFIEGMPEAEIAGAYAEHFRHPKQEAVAHIQQLAGRLGRADVLPYRGRESHPSPTRLRECWLHVTNRCNARCRHCMFACSPSETEELSTGTALSIVKQASQLGCEVFYFTGGEPLLHEGLFDVCGHILRETSSHVVILTNGIAFEKFLPKMVGWDRERVHLQVGIDGIESNHDAMRGPGAFRHLLKHLRQMTNAGFPVTLAMTVCRENIADMSELPHLARELGIGNIHYLWLFERGNAGHASFVPPEEIYPHLIAAATVAEESGVLIDNIEILKSQVFSIPGTRFDLSNAGWESLAVGPDGRVYPSPALVSLESACCGNIRDGLKEVWLKSERLGVLRASSSATTPAYRSSPFCFLIGGGDIDHSMTHGGAFTGHDPYVPLYNRVALWLMTNEASRFPDTGLPGFRFRMGDRLHDCSHEGNGSFFTHSNCVLSLPGRNGHSLARDFYARAAKEPNEEIRNPVSYADEAASLIPEEAQVRSYGCGSPVDDAALCAGETVVDLGSGAGGECFLASSLVGRTGSVIGLDMLPEMLQIANAAARKVGERLGYSNVVFCRALLEDLPLADDSVDAVLSNCVINLSPQKRRTFQEILRVLKPGGRLLISDVVSDDDIPIEIQYSEKLRGECLGGAFKENRLFQLLSDLGFQQARIVKRFPYREVRGHQFFSLTYSAIKPVPRETQRVLYPGPFAAVLTDGGEMIQRGQTVEISWSAAPGAGEAVFVLDAEGKVTNARMEPTCACFTAPASEPLLPLLGSQKHQSGCMLCGASLEYLEGNREQACAYCGRRKSANALCANGHFVCDQCHSEDALQVIEQACLHSSEIDLVALFTHVRTHKSIPLHGPEHHSLVPAVILAAYRNSGGVVSDELMKTAIQRGSTVAGGACAFLGACGAATGVSLAFSLLRGATPYKGDERQLLQIATSAVLSEIAAYAAPRCCQRECWIALRAAARLSKDLLPLPLSAEGPLSCTQYELNQECILSVCPLWPD